jgi:hypothetical protein
MYIFNTEKYVTFSLFVAVTKYLRRRLKGRRVYFGLQFERADSIATGLW